MDQETREMFGKVLGILEVMRTDVSELKTDVSGLKADVSQLKTDMEVMKADVSQLKTDMEVMKADVSQLKTEMDVMNQRMDVMGSRQDEMYLMLKGSEESRQRIKALEEKSLISAIEMDQLKMESAKIVGALRRSAQATLDALAS